MSVVAVIDDRNGEMAVHLFDDSAKATEWCEEASLAEGYDYDPEDPDLSISTDVQDHRGEASK